MLWAAAPTVFAGRGAQALTQNALILCWNSTRNSAGIPLEPVPARGLRATAGRAFRHRRDGGVQHWPCRPTRRDVHCVVAGAGPYVVSPAADNQSPLGTGPHRRTNSVIPRNLRCGLRRIWTHLLIETLGSQAIGRRRRSPSRPTGRAGAGWKRKRFGDDVVAAPECNASTRGSTTLDCSHSPADRTPRSVSTSIRGASFSFDAEVAQSCWPNTPSAR